MRKTAETEADAVMFDLEDAVPEGRKPQARENIREVVGDTDFGAQEVCTRINGLETDHWLEDLRVSAEVGVDVVRLAMVEQAWEINTVVETMKQYTADLPDFIVAIETPLGMASGIDIATVCREFPSMAGITFGLQDYTSTLGAPEPSSNIREHLLHLTAGFGSIGGMDPLGGAYLNIDDDEGLQASAEQAKTFGHIAQPVLHPKQIKVVHDVFTPSQETYERSKRFIEAFDEAEDDTIAVDGVVLEPPIVDRYRRQVARYESINR